MNDGPLCLGIGHCLPDRQVPNAVLEAELGLEPGWIVRRTGFVDRRYCDAGQATSDLAIPAGRQALLDSGVAAGDLGLVLLATSTPDHPLPGTAPLVAARLGSQAPAIDLMAACTGFLHGLALADQVVRGTGRPVLLIGANVLSRRVDPGDPRTRVLFADGAGAMVLGPAVDSTGRRDELGGPKLMGKLAACPTSGEPANSADVANTKLMGKLAACPTAGEPASSADVANTTVMGKLAACPTSGEPAHSGVSAGEAARHARGVLATWGRSDGEQWQRLHIPAGGSRQPWRSDLAPAACCMQMPSGQAVFRLAVDAMAEAGQAVLDAAGVDRGAVDWLVAHQASLRIVQELGERLRIPQEKRAWWLGPYGNSSAATIPIALSLGRESGRIQAGQLLLLTAAGAGFSSAAALLRWS